MDGVESIRLRRIPSRARTAWLAARLVCLLAFCTAAGTHARTQSILTLDAAGNQIGSFDLSITDEQFIRAIEVDHAGHYWVGISDRSQTRNEFKPGDRVVKFAPDGTPLLEVKGPMRAPRSIAIDTLGNIFVGGVPDGGSLSAHSVYRFAPDGSYRGSFGLNNSASGYLGASYVDLEEAPGGGVFAASSLPDSVERFNQVGTKTATTRNSGPAIPNILRGVALSEDEQTLWAIGRNQFTKQTLIYERDANDLSLIQTFILPEDQRFIQGLERNADGDLATRNLGEIEIYSTQGALIDTITIPGWELGMTSHGFAIDAAGNYVVDSVPEPASLPLLVIAGLFAARRRRDRN
ncbi:MAG: PEP-CTERM sorting domain-containing protein [Phycisphaeraceae bacterium]